MSVLCSASKVTRASMTVISVCWLDAVTVYYSKVGEGYE